MVLYRLDTHGREAALTGKAREDVAAAELSDAHAGDRAQLDELAGLYADKTIGVREWVAARKPIEGRIEETERRLGRLTRTDALAGLVGNGAQLANSWGSLNLTQKWRINMNTNYDIMARQFSFTSFSVYRDLHCWEMSLNFVPFGRMKSYSFTLNARTSVLRDLKVSKQRSFYDNF